MMWTLYDELIEAIPGDLVVSNCVVGLHWVAVQSEGVGMAATPSEKQAEGERSIGFAGKIVGMSVRELAAYAKSWNIYEAALGFAAINSVLNTAARAESLLGCHLFEAPSVTAFDFFKAQYRGKKVAVVGHFPRVEALAEVCELTVLERRVHAGDYPDPACEFLLPEQDFVFITAATLANKTLPRLLELCGKAYTVLVGPSAPLTPALFKYGVDALASCVVVEQPAVWRAIQEGANLRMFKSGVCKIQLVAAPSK